MLLAFLSVWPLSAHSVELSQGSRVSLGMSMLLLREGVIPLIIFTALIIISMVAAIYSKDRNKRL